MTEYSFRKARYPHTIAICRQDGCQILTLDIDSEGYLTANYEDGNLDEAAKIFVREILRIAGRQ